MHEQIACEDVANEEVAVVVYGGQVSPLTEVVTITVPISEEKYATHTPDKIKKGAANTLAEKQSQMTNWDTIKDIDQLRMANIRAVTSRLQPLRTYSTESRQIHVITGEDIIARRQLPECMSTSMLGDYLCLSKTSNGNQHKQQNRQKLRSLLQLLPPLDVKNTLTSAWSLLTKEDVSYQASSLRMVAQSVVNEGLLQKEIWTEMSGETGETKTAQINQTKELINLALSKLKTVHQLNAATHGGLVLFEAVWDIIASVLPDSDTTPEQINSRIKRLKRDYKKTVDNNQSSVKGKKACVYFDELDTILGYRPDIIPDRLLQSAVPRTLVPVSPALSSISGSSEPRFDMSLSDSDNEKKFVVKVIEGDVGTDQETPLAQAPAIMQNGPQLSADVNQKRRAKKRKNDGNSNVDQIMECFLKYQKEAQIRFMEHEDRVREREEANEDRRRKEDREIEERRLVEYRQHELRVLEMMARTIQPTQQPQQMIHQPIKNEQLDSE